MALRLAFSLLSLWVTIVGSKVTEGPWLTNGAPLPIDGLRVTTLGSGTPDVRKDQVSSGFLLELGNDDKFIWDLGTGAYQNLLATGIPAAQLTKVFLTHLHSDHIADLATFYAGAMFGRTEPWEVWGPSSEQPQLGLNASIAGLRQFMAWDTFSRRRIDLVGRQDDGDKVIAHEFDFSIPNQLIYSRNGVNITSTPVSHYQTDGPVALRLDWNGLSVTYSGDTHPVNSLLNLAKGSDIYIEQCMGPIKDFGALPNNSQYLLNTSHVTPEQAGHLFKAAQPKLGVLHHLLVNDASRSAIVTAVRETYDGPITINEDLMAFDLTRDEIVIRKRLVPTRSWGYWHAELNSVVKMPYALQQHTLQVLSWQ